MAGVFCVTGTSSPRPRHGEGILRYNEAMTATTNNRTIKKKSISSRRRARFLAALESHGIIKRACEDAGVDPSNLYSVMKQEPEFKAEVDAAVREQGLDALLDEARARALGYGRRASDSLLMFLIKQADPSYKENYVPPQRPHGDIVGIGAVYAAMYEDVLQCEACLALNPELLSDRSQSVPVALPEPPQDDFNPLQDSQHPRVRGRGA